MEKRGPCIELEHVSKSFGDPAGPARHPPHHQSRQFLTFLGPSGAARPHPRLLAGSSGRPGRIRIGGADVTDMPPHLRAENTVFPELCPFPHMTVFDNVAFGLRMRRTQAKVIEEEVFSALRMVKMEAHHTRRPGQLSGGQQQRCAIARAVVKQAPGAAARRASLGPGLQAAHRPCSSNSRNCAARSASPSSSSPTTRRRPFSMSIGWRS